MTLSTEAKRAQFRRLHESGCFVIPNPWDIGSAVALQSLGFKALASTSSGFAWTIGKADNHITLEDALAHLTAALRRHRPAGQRGFRGRLRP